MVYHAPTDFITINPIIFLAGPIQGSNPEWHKKAIEIIKKYAPNIVVACPKRDEFNKKEFDYEEQVDWETKYLQKASEFGGILFYLNKEHENVEGRSYAQTTRYELAEWVTKHKENNDINIAIAYDDEFTGLRYIKHRTNDLDIIKTNDLDYAILQLIKKIYE